MVDDPVLKLWTIGYEKASQGEFIATLKAAGIQLVCDVRDRPQSRRAGFSKRQLAASLDEAGISYLHLKALGTPKEGRVAHRSGDLVAFRMIYEQQITSPEAKEALTGLADLVAVQRSCLVCYEANWQMCHRAQIIEHLRVHHAVEAFHLAVEPIFV